MRGVDDADPAMGAVARLRLECDLDVLAELGQEAHQTLAGKVGEPSQTFPGWLDLLTTLMPETVKLEVSSYLLIVALVALWIWRRPRRGCGRRKE